MGISKISKMRMVLIDIFKETHENIGIFKNIEVYLVLNGIDGYLLFLEDCSPKIHSENN